MNRDQIKQRSQCVLLGVLLLGLAAGGCSFAMPKPAMKPEIHPPQDVAATYDQIRLRMRSLVAPLCGELESAADQIRAGATNAAVQRAALIWKIEGVPALRAALFQPGPYTALLDSWILCDQMTDYFETGPGKEALGESSPLAVAACRRMEAEINRVAATLSLSGDVTKAREFARKWAGEHPLRYSIAARETALSRVLERDAPATFTAGEAVATITTTVDDLNRRLEVYSDQLVRQARWEAELFKLDFLSEPSVAQALPLAGRAVATVDRLVPAAERAASVAESAPKFLAAEREATLKQLHEDMLAQRQKLTQDLEQISLKMVDHAFWRAVELLAIVAALVIIFRKFFRTKKL